MARAARRADPGRVADRRRERVGHERDHGGGGDAVPDRRVRGRAADQGRDGRRDDRPGPGHARARHADQRGRRPDRPRGHGRRRRAHGQRVHHGHDRGRRGGRADGQARQPGRVVGVRGRGRAGGARRGDRPAARPRPRSWPPRSGSAFLFAPLYHPALRYAGPTRSELGVPTVFNFLGPVANPARPSAQAVGVADPRMGEVIAGVLAGRGCSALVFRGDGRAGRADHHRPVDGVGGARRPGRQDASSRPGRARAGPGLSSRICAAATPRTTRPWSARCWPASAARCATSCC